MATSCCQCCNLGNRRSTILVTTVGHQHGWQDKLNPPCLWSGIVHILYVLYMPGEFLKAEAQKLHLSIVFTLYTSLRTDREQSFIRFQVTVVFYVSLKTNAPFVPEVT